MLKVALAFVALAAVLVLSVPEFSDRLRQIVAARDTTPPEAPATPSSAARVMLTADGRGHFETKVAINGRPVQALIDTGASMVALTYEDARSLGLVRPGDRFDIEVQTGNGKTAMKRVSLNSVRIGGISLSNIDAMIARDGDLPVNLLGMSFLKELRSFEIRDGRLVLEQ